MLEEGGGQALTMRALATRLGVTPMSLYRHVTNRAGLLRIVSDRVYAEVLNEADLPLDVRTVLIRYYEAVGRHPQLTLAIFATPEALAGISVQISEYVAGRLADVTDEPVLWRDILIDHAHGSGLALASVQGNQEREEGMREQYGQALDRLLERLA